MGNTRPTIPTINPIIFKRREWNIALVYNKQITKTKIADEDDFCYDEANCGYGLVVEREPSKFDAPFRLRLPAQID